MEQYLFNLSAPPDEAADVPAMVQPNVWLLSADEIPPILFTTEEVARLLGIGKCRVYDLIRTAGAALGQGRRLAADLREGVAGLRGPSSCEESA